jgi:hypothetical protein
MSGSVTRKRPRHIKDSFERFAVATLSYISWEQRDSSLVHLADGSPELIRHDIERGYGAVRVPALQACSGNPLKKTRYVWRHRETGSLAQIESSHQPLQRVGLE